MSTKRMLQLGEQIRNHIAMMLVRGEIHDPRVKSVTIHSVKMTSDLQHAKVYFTCSPKEHKEILKGLKQASSFIRHELGKQLQIRFTPHVLFFYDDSLDYSLKMVSLLSKVRAELKENAESAEACQTPDEKIHE